MLVDIFARRYEGIQLRNAFDDRDRRLLVQAFRILSEDMYRYYDHTGKESSAGVAFWTTLHSRLSRELGVKELSPQWFSYPTQWQGKTTNQVAKHPLVRVCENWMHAPVAGSPDQHIKERLSLVELGFREREGEINKMNTAPITPELEGISRLAMRVPGNAGDGARFWRESHTQKFRSSVEELNERFRQAAYPLHYHNGFIQAATDLLIQHTVETPFWALLADPIWANVDLEMKEALDLRDSGGRDPAFYAAKALESTIKIISGSKGWTIGNERGAHNYIDHLAAKKNAFITPWEAQSLKAFFTDVRNPFGHGAGSGEMPRLTAPQTEWAIEFSMSWIKALIRRL